jgi:hypothetical protein
VRLIFPWKLAGVRGQELCCMRTRTLEMAGGVLVVVPDSLNLLTPYVLFEQRDWFEDEIGFIRRTGAVWAFEPALSCSRLR